MPKAQAKLKLICNLTDTASAGIETELTDQALFWLSASAELLNEEFDSIESAIDALIHQVLKRFNNMDQLTQSEFHGFLRLVIETDEELKTSLMRLLFPHSS